jgi:hypothetical protein
MSQISQSSQTNIKEKKLTLEDDPETILFEHNINKENIQNALNVAKLFIMRKKRILTGGMAIDLVLKLKGSKLYAENKLPDYDCYSPAHCSDAYELANELVKKGFKNVSAIRAFHISTMKVRVDFTDVADISFVPENIYEKIPTLSAEGFVIVHPHFQNIDQHRSLSLPYEKPPLETIFGRWEKDFKRFDMLVEHYPMTLNDDEIDAIKTMNFNKIDRTIPSWMIADCCFCGLTALQFWLSKAIFDGYIDKSVRPDLYGQLDYTSLSAGVGESQIKMTSSLPDCAADIIVLSRDFQSVLSKLDLNNTADQQEIIFHNELLDKISRKICVDTYEILDTKGLLVSCCRIDGICVVGLQYLMCWFLSVLLLQRSSLCNETYLIYKSGYLTCLDILRWACAKYCEGGSAIDKMKKYLPSTIEVYGVENWYPAYLYSIYESRDRAKYITTVPKNYYPDADAGDELCKFDASKSEWFQFDGMPCAKFEPKTV